MSMQSWKGFQQQIKSSRWSQRVKLSALVVIVLLVVARFAMFVDWLADKPVQHEEVGILSDIQWDTREQLNIFVNPNWVIGYQSGVGELQYFKMAELAEPQSLVVQLKEQAVLLDAYLWLPVEITDPTELGEQVFRALVKDELKTNMTRLQVLRLWWGLRQELTVRVQTRHQLPEASILEEGLKIGIFNGTSVAGLALESSIWVENLGGEVIELANADQLINQNLIEVYLPQGRYRTVERLEQIFRTGAVFVETTVSQRFDVKIMVSKTFLQY